MRRPPLACSQISNLFRVDISDGTLFWRTPPKQHPRLAGKEAGFPHFNANNGKSYWTVKIGKTQYKRSYIVFTWVHGRWPSNQIDHIDGNSLNDRPANLREVTSQQNSWNQRSRAKASCLPMGVRSLRSKFQARISKDGKTYYRTFSTVDDARAFYLLKRSELFGEYSGL